LGNSGGDGGGVGAGSRVSGRHARPHKAGPAAVVLMAHKPLAQCDYRTLNRQPAGSLGGASDASVQPAGVDVALQVLGMTGMTDEPSSAILRPL
jgi:hypothetical protein